MTRLRAMAAALAVVGSLASQNTLMPCVPVQAPITKSDLQTGSAE